MDYLKALQHIAAVNEHDEIVGKIERWEAHKKGILHRAFTIAIQFENQLILQHRKHPVFDGVFDVTISSHPIYTEDALQDTIDAVYATLEREWYVKKSDLTAAPVFIGKLKYQAEDPHSEYQEHEICHIYTCSVTKLSLPNFDCAYGFSLQKIEDIKKEDSYLHLLLAPWVKEMLKKGML